MAIGTTTAIIGSIAAGAGASYLSAREQSDAISDAQYAQDQSNREALQFARETRDLQMGLAEPFRQFGVQQANFLGEIFGFDPVGQSAGAGSAGQAPPVSQMPLPSQQNPQVAEQNRYAQYVNANPDLRREWEAFTGRPGGRTFGPNLPQSYDRNGDGALSVDEYGAFHFDRFGRAEGRELPGQTAQAPGSVSTSPAFDSGAPVQMAANDPVRTSPAFATGQPVEMVGNGSAPGANSGGINTEAQDRSRQRFENSMFFDALNGQLADAATGIDANMAASGAVYSGAREAAQGLARSRYGMDALTRYIGAGLGQPSTAGASMAGNAAGQFGATAGNLALNRGATAANSAYQRGDLTSNLAGNFANLASYGLGAFANAGGGGSSGGGGSFNFGYQPGMFVG